MELDEFTGRAVRGAVLEVLVRINDKALWAARDNESDWEALAKAYDQAIMKELADLTAPTN